MTDLFNILNNLFYDDTIIDEFKLYLTNKANYSNSNYIKKFKRNNFNHFILRENKIIFKPLNLEVIKKADINIKLDDLYKNDNNSIGKGITNFYKYVASKYINITRDDIKKFLEDQDNYQMTKNINHKINKPIIAKYPNQQWCIDLVEFNDLATKNKNYKYMLVCVDVFSRYVWLEPLKFKEASITRDAVIKIINDAGVSPSSILTDNGKEFEGELKEYCNDNNIKLLHTRAYSPESNGIVERANKDIRKIINAFWLKNNNNVWYNILNEVAENKNSSYNSTIKGTPISIWVNNKDKIPRDLPENLIVNNPKMLAKVSLVKRAIKLIDKFKEEDNYQVNDVVRIKMSSIFNNIRKLLKEGKSKQIVVNFTPDVFWIQKVIHTRKSLIERNKYILMNDQDEVLKKADGTVKYFYASDLQHYDYDEEQQNTTEISMEEALKLNKVERNNNDIIYE